MPTPPDVRLPRQGRAREDILESMQGLRRDDADYRSGKTWSLVYYLGEEHEKFLHEVYGRFMNENGLNPFAFQSLKRMESDIVRMTAALLHGGRETVGVWTSGGTESCMLAVKTARDRKRGRFHRRRRVEMIVPESVHVAFEKGAEYFDVKSVRAPLTKDFRVDVKAVRKLVNSRTALIVGSAPAYPHGVIDPIAELGDIAWRKGIPLHVDACLGGFMLPFVEKLGHRLPPFDFRVPGVTSMSADLHKYGYASKGASVLLHRNMDYMKHQFFVFTDWPGGVFASPALLGTRPGGALAAAWAAMQVLGEEGYLRLASITMETTRKLIDGVNAIEGLAVLGEPAMSVFSYRSVDPRLNILAVGDRMEARGWHIDRQQRPEALHAMVTVRHAEVADAYLADLRTAVAEVRADPSLASSGRAAMYGMIANIPLRGLIRDNVRNLMAQVYGPDGAANLDAAGEADDLASRAGRMFLQVRERLKRRL